MRDTPFDRPFSGDGPPPLDGDTAAAEDTLFDRALSVVSDGKAVRIVRGKAYATVRQAHLGPPDETLWDYFRRDYLRDGRLDQAAVKARFDLLDDWLIPQERQTLEKLTNRLRGYEGKDRARVLEERAETLKRLQLYGRERAQLRAFAWAHGPAGEGSERDRRPRHYTRTNFQHACTVLDLMEEVGEERWTKWKTYASMKRKLEAYLEEGTAPGAVEPGAVEKGAKRALEALGVEYTRETFFRRLAENAERIREALADLT